MNKRAASASSLGASRMLALVTNIVNIGSIPTVVKRGPRIKRVGLFKRLLPVSFRANNRRLFSSASDAFRQSVHGVFTRVQPGANGEKPVEYRVAPGYKMIPGTHGDGPRHRSS